jgi:predicted small metal-binding protein
MPDPNVAALAAFATPLLADGSTPSPPLRVRRSLHRRKVMKELRCREVGFDCEGVIRADAEDELLRQAADHARAEHGVTELDEDTIRQIRSKIRTV